MVLVEDAGRIFPSGRATSRADDGRGSFAAPTIPVVVVVSVTEASI
jgi:hypothetical protein